MKKIVLFLMVAMFATNLFAQRVITQPKEYKWTTIVNGSTLSSSITSDNFVIKNMYGNATVWFKIGSVDSVKSDVTVKLKLYNSETTGWGDYLSGNTLTTISSSEITAGNEFYIKLTDYDAWAWADKAELVISVSSTSSFTLYVYVGGQ